MWEYLNSSYLDPLEKELAELAASGADPKKMDAVRMTFARMQGYVQYMRDHGQKEGMKHDDK